VRSCDHPGAGALTFSFLRTLSIGSKMASLDRSVLDAQVTRVVRERALFVSSRTVVSVLAVVVLSCLALLGPCKSLSIPAQTAFFSCGLCCKSVAAAECE